MKLIKKRVKIMSKIKPKILSNRVKLETLQDSVILIQRIIDAAKEKELDVQEITELVVSILDLYGLIVDEEELEELIRIFEDSN